VRSDRTIHARPIVGVTGPDAGGAAAWWFTRLAVWLAGGHAVRITPSRPRRIDGLDALVVGGGADVDPTLYGHDPEPVMPKARAPDDPVLPYVLEWFIFPLTWLARGLSGLLLRESPKRDAARDELELRLIGAAVARRIPVLGVCRGAQLVNVYFGGSLLTPGTRLARLLDQESRRVNALHRQAIDRLGRGLVVAARDRNGIVQAIEHESLPFVVGVQWHPEYLPQVPEQRALFNALVAQAKRRRAADDTSSPMNPVLHAGS